MLYIITYVIIMLYIITGKVLNCSDTTRRLWSYGDVSTLFQSHISTENDTVLMNFLVKTLLSYT